MKPRTICIYGESGTAKTSNIGLFAKYIYETLGKKTRLISADGGGWNPIQAYIDAGIIEVFPISALENPVSTLRKLSRGLWFNDDGRQTAEGLKDVGAYAIEGITSTGDTIMRDLRLKGPKLAQDPGFQFKEGDETFYGSNMTYFGFVQDTVQELIHSFSQLPVSRVLWTALESRGEDDARQPIYGPQIVGKKLLAKLPAMFGTLIHHEGLVTTAKPSTTGGLATTVSTRLVAYFQRHPDPLTQVHYPAKPRVAPEQLPELEKRFPGGFYPLTLESGIDAYLRVEDELGEGAASALAGWKSKVDAARGGN